ncbi:MAG TPA: PadR family transcriptional regulator [Methanothermobacter sp.]|uniref:Transcriptional regulator n=1 Tax=Methanothermobacter tenebrarum TaxID=680118 RepID=A0ABM7YBJ1_9EURY|nr:PadR family transcriptional regulator [Methanothermobacter tenebrarum]MDD3454272.1 PadR family transcriptional regulator [Methanobacteriales archaeon]MDI6882574.1 PadR family transcriptional regulator [Methanothermobacter sp.]MDX9693856.1 PadR family transcriptional regulator [Methanothermobacter sp.]BDH78678.1 transcriptional regulator [Methanothermobacter tenebrarum]HHW16354.1 PadR family transcriptional regulator [Methanothermobacter sp.]
MKDYNNHIIKSFMRGFGKTMILLMINKERTHGYEIMKKLHRFYSIKGHRIKPPGPSIIYPILHDLEKRGLIKGEWELKGEKRVKYYKITPQGEETVKKIKHIMKDHIMKIWEEFWEDSAKGEKGVYR